MIIWNDDSFCLEMKILKKKKLYIANSDDDIYIHIKYKENRFIIENLLKKKKKSLYTQGYMVCILVWK